MDQERVDFAPLPLNAFVSEQLPIQIQTDELPETKIDETPVSSESKLTKHMIGVFLTFFCCIAALWIITGIIMGYNSGYKPGFFMTVSQNANCGTNDCIMIKDVLFYEQAEINGTNIIQQFWTCRFWKSPQERPTIITINLPGFYMGKSQECTVYKPTSTKELAVIGAIISSVLGFFTALILILMMCLRNKKIVV